MDEALVDLLDRSKWLRDLTWPEMQRIALYLRKVPVRGGKVVIAEGARESSMYIVVEGCLAVVKENSVGAKRTLVALTPGKTVGEIALFDGAPRSATVMARQDSVLLQLDRPHLLRLMADDPRLASKILFKMGVSLSQRLRMASGKLVDKV